jgi:hypothetical protein
MNLRLAAACLIFLWMTGLAAEAEECQGNSRALGASFPVANAEEWAATLEAPAATSTRWAEWASPWLVEAVPSSLPLAKAAHAAASRVSTVSSPGSNATRHLAPWKIASLPSG